MPQQTNQQPIVPSWDEFFMRHAYLASSKSKDLRTRIGAVIVRDKRVISEGYNGICQGVRDNIKTRVVKPDKYTWFEHAERNSIFNCARYGITSLGAIMYTQGVPCCECARALIQAGIAQLVIHKQWEDRSGLRDNPKWTKTLETSVKMITEAQIPIFYWDGELGLDGFCDGRLFKV